MNTTLVQQHDHPLDDDLRPAMFRAAREFSAFALATIVSADGGPRPVGTQMVVTKAGWKGFLTGGCIEADVALHAQDTLWDGIARRRVYGNGSPYMDLRLPCGNRLEVLIERIDFADAALRELERQTSLRQPALWISNGRDRICAAFDHATTVPVETGDVRIVFRPKQRLVVIGSDPFSVGLANLGVRIGWEVDLLGTAHHSFDSTVPGLTLFNSSIDRYFRSCPPDPWTAVAVTTHDTHTEVEALAAALTSKAGYVGVMGSRSRIDERNRRLAKMNVPVAATARLHSPIGLTPGAVSPWEFALSVAGQIMSVSREAESSAHSFRRGEAKGKRRQQQTVAQRQGTKSATLSRGSARAI